MITNFSHEMDVVSRTNIWRGFNVTYSNATTSIAFGLILVPYIILGGGVLRAESIFLVLSLFSIVKQSMTDLVPNSMKMIGEALISIGRIQAFLEAEEIREDVPALQTAPAAKDAAAAATLSELWARWGAAATPDVLKSISLEIKVGQLCTAIGPVGAGKVCEAKPAVIMRGIVASLANGAFLDAPRPPCSNVCSER